MKRMTTWVLMVCLVPYLTGCTSLTSGLWSSDLATDHGEATGNPDLRVLDGGEHKDYLVQYYEERTSSGAKRRSYWLYENDARIRAGKKPRFVNAHAADGLKPIPVEISTVEATLAVTNGATGSAIGVPIAAQIAPFATNGAPVYVVLLADHRRFVLVAGGSEAGMFALPVYRRSSSEATLYALTPVTVTGDVVCTLVVVGTVVGIVYFYVVYANGTPNPNNP